MRVIYKPSFLVQKLVHRHNIYGYFCNFGVSFQSKNIENSIKYSKINIYKISKNPFKSLSRYKKTRNYCFWFLIVVFFLILYSRIILLILEQYTFGFVTKETLSFCPAPTERIFNPCAIGFIIVFV